MGTYKGKAGIEVSFQVTPITKWPIISMYSPSIYGEPDVHLQTQLKPEDRVALAVDILGDLGIVMTNFIVPKEKLDEIGRVAFNPFSGGFGRGVDPDVSNDASAVGVPTRNQEGDPENAEGPTGPGDGRLQVSGDGPTGALPVVPPAGKPGGGLQLQPDRTARDGKERTCTFSPARLIGSLRSTRFLAAGHMKRAQNHMARGEAVAASQELSNHHWNAGVITGYEWAMRDILGDSPELEEIKSDSINGAEEDAARYLY